MTKIVPSVKNSRLEDIDGIKLKFNENKDKRGIVIIFSI